MYIFVKLLIYQNIIYGYEWGTKLNKKVLKKEQEGTLISIFMFEGSFALNFHPKSL